jgi:hypothetical protein
VPTLGEPAEAPDRLSERHSPVNRTTPTDAPRPRSNTSGLPRRALVSAAAWSAPAIVLTTTSPAAATSTKLGVITFITDSAQLDGGTTHTLVGMFTPAEGGALPSELTLAYSGAVTGPSTLAVSGDTFLVVIDAVDPEGATASTVTATATGYASAEYDCTVVPAPPALGTITMTSTPGAIPQGEEGTATGRLTATVGGSLPKTIDVKSSNTGVATVPTVATVAADGTFIFPVTAVAASGTATVTVSASGYSPESFTVVTAVSNSTTFRFDLPACNTRVEWEFDSTDLLIQVPQRVTDGRGDTWATWGGGAGGLRTPGEWIVSTFKKLYWSPYYINSKGFEVFEVYLDKPVAPQTWEFTIRRRSGVSGPVKVTWSRAEGGSATSPFATGTQTIVI